MSIPLSRRRRRIGKLLFALPLLVLAAAIVYGYLASSQPGNLVVEARDAHNMNPLGVQAYVSSTSTSTPTILSVTTPTTLSLTQGVYTISFSQLQWYQRPGSKTVSLPAGRTAYALGEYTPTPEI